MRRRFRSAAASPFHRHACPRWRSTRGWSRSPTSSPTSSASTATSRAATPISSSGRSRSSSSGASFVFALFGLYRHWLRYATQRDYLQIAQAVRRRDARARWPTSRSSQPRLTLRRRRASSSVTVPASVLVLYGLLMLVFIGGARFLAHLALRAPAARLPRPQGRALGPHRRRGRRRPPAAARDPAQPRPRLPPGRLRRRRPAQAGRADRPRRSRPRHDGRAPARARRRRARRGPDRHPVRAGHDARPRRRRLPRARRPGAHAADGLRAAADRRPRCCARSARSRSRTSSAASRCGWTSTASAAT